MSSEASYFRSYDLPVAGEFFFDFAETLAGEALSRDRAVNVVEKRSSGGVIETKFDPLYAELNPLELLKVIRDIHNYKGTTNEISRDNSQTIACLGGSAAYGIYGLTIESGLPSEAMDGVRSSFLEVHGKIDAAFSPTARTHTKDAEATIYLRELGILLTGY